MFKQTFKIGAWHFIAMAIIQTAFLYFLATGIMDNDYTLIFAAMTIELLAGYIVLGGDIHEELH